MPNHLKAPGRLASKVRQTGRPAYIVAAVAGLAPWQLSGYMRGKPIPRLHLMRLCDALGCAPEEILGP